MTKAKETEFEGLFKYGVILDHKMNYLNMFRACNKDGRFEGFIHSKPIPYPKYKVKTDRKKSERFMITWKERKQDLLIAEKLAILDIEKQCKKLGRKYTLYGEYIRVAGHDTKSIYTMNK